MLACGQGQRSRVPGSVSPSGRPQETRFQHEDYVAAVAGLGSWLPDEFDAGAVQARQVPAVVVDIDGQLRLTEPETVTRNGRYWPGMAGADQKRPAPGWPPTISGCTAPSWNIPDAGRPSGREQAHHHRSRGPGSSTAMISSRTDRRDSFPRRFDAPAGGRHRRGFRSPESLGPVVRQPLAPAG